MTVKNYAVFTMNFPISDYLKIQMFIKIGVMLQASQLIICLPKSKIYENL